MLNLVEPALQNLSSPAILFFGLGLAASILRSDLAIPEAIAKLLAIYLLLSIGFRGGSEIAHHGMDGRMLMALATGAALSFLVPFAAFAVLRSVTTLQPLDAAAVAAHYGSISIVTFIAASGALDRQAVPYEGFMVGVAAAMETPAIVAALLIARRRGATNSTSSSAAPWREVILNGSVVVLIGALVIGFVSGERGASQLRPFVTMMFPGFLCLFLLDMGLLVGRGLEQGRRHISLRTGLFAVVFPLLAAFAACLLATLIGLSPGGTMLLMTLAASASYIAVPAALRLALPEANPAIGLTLSLGVTFPFNLVLGIPLYMAIAARIAE